MKCAEISGGAGFVTMADGKPIYIFGFGPLTQTLVSDVVVDTSKTDYTKVLVTDPGQIVASGTLNANAPAPTIAIDEDDELFLTLSHVGMVMRPDLFDQHTVHFHGYPNAAPIFDGLPDASIAIQIGGSFTYYYNAPAAGTYFYHCHVQAPEHLQMGMIGQLFVRPRQNRTGAGGFGVAKLVGGPASSPLGYAYDDGDGSTRYDYEYPIQITGFDPDFHYADTSFNPVSFADMHDKYFLLNGRGYPDTINPATIYTVGADGPGPSGAYPNGAAGRPSQPVSSAITVPKNKRVLLRISNVSTAEFSTLGTTGIPMQVVALDARLLRDEAGNNLYYTTNSLTMGGGQTADVILDTTGVDPGTYFLYSTNLDHLVNDQENFGGEMTEIVVQ
jgi:FtsP/CotA-like multicopper oxidase with cupredoxin domain